MTTGTPVLSDNDISLLFRKVKQTLAKEKNVPDEIKVFIHSLRLTGYRYSEIATLFNITETAVKSILNDPTFTSSRLQELYTKTEATMRDRLMAMGNTIMASISEEDLEKASLLQKTTAVSQIIDKARLLGGKSTSNIAHAYELAGMGAPQIAEELTQITEQLML